MPLPGSSQTRSARDILALYTIATVGLFMVAFGIALSVVANLGTAPLSCPACIMSGTWGITVGGWNVIVNMLYIFVQLAILRKDFKPGYLMQIPASLLFGCMIDLGMLCLQWLHPVSLLPRACLLLLSCIVTAFGVSVEVKARAWMLSAEMTVYAVVGVTGKPFPHVKVAMDFTVVAISLLLALLIYGNPVGSGEFTGIADWLSGSMKGVVTGAGTLVLAFGAGWMMRFTDPLVGRILDPLKS